MNELAIKGRNRTIRICACVLLISLYTIVTYNIVLKDVSALKLIQQIIRFSLTILLIYFLFKGKEWSRLLLTFLFSLALLLCLYSLFESTSLIAKVPIITMTLIYSVFVYHLNFSRSFKDYFKYLRAES